MARPDPRVDPTTDPPRAVASVERVAVSTITATLEAPPPPADLEAILGKNDPEPTSAPASPAVVAPATADIAAAPKPTGIAAEIEPLVARNDWKAVADALGPLEQAAELPPGLALVAAVAHNEISKESNDAMRELALVSTATLLGMRVDSDVVRVLSRRLLRKNPVGFRQRPAPPARVSLLIVFVVLALGAGVGWFLSSGMSSRLFGR